MTPEDLMFKFGYYVCIAGLSLVVGGIGIMSAALALGLIKELFK